MNVYRVWSTKDHRDPEKGARERKGGTGIERCVMNDCGHYIGLETGTLYPASNHYHSDNYKAKIINVDATNLTGMYHLSDDIADEVNAITKKRKYLGAFITVVKAHSASGLQIYYCLELSEYFSEKEIEILE